jgi:pSer/pThr/pTyr-binding forkhead associated (FHA) protein/ribosomal protein L37E
MAKPVKCERCGRENDPSLNACLDCGRPLPSAAPPSAGTCGRCGAVVQAGFRFCAQCGFEVAPRPATGNTTQRGLRLTVMRTDGVAGPAFPLLEPLSVCGRLEGSLRIPDDATVSPRHARFSVRGETVLVEDLGSVNGTFVRIRSPHRLEPGDELRLGRQLLRVEPLPRPPQEAPSARAWGAADPGCRMRLAQLLEGGGLGEIHPLHEGENVLGREAGEVVFPGDRYVSARHARIDLSKGEVTVTDLGSSNGTFRKITGPTPLAPGDQLLIGAQLLKLEA